MSSIPESLDRERVTMLAGEMMMIIRSNYLKGPQSRDRVYEALNALAFCAAVVIRGSDKNEALAFFSDALNVTLNTEGPP